MILGLVIAFVFFGACIIVGICAKNRKEHRSSGNPKHPFGIPMSDKKVPWTGYRFLGDDDSGRKKG